MLNFEIVSNSEDIILEHERFEEVKLEPLLFNWSFYNEDDPMNISTLIDLRLNLDIELSVSRFVSIFVNK